MPRKTLIRSLLQYIALLYVISARDRGDSAIFTPFCLLRAIPSQSKKAHRSQKNFRQLLNTGILFHEPLPVASAHTHLASITDFCSTPHIARRFIWGFTFIFLFRDNIILSQGFDQVRYYPLLFLSPVPGEMIILAYISLSGSGFLLLRYSRVSALFLFASS